MNDEFCSISWKNKCNVHRIYLISHVIPLTKNSKFTRCIQNNPYGKEYHIDSKIYMNPIIAVLIGNP